MMEVFAGRYGAASSEITPQELETARGRVRTKFGTDEWLHRVP
jgi:lipoate-protein ligase A